MRYVIINISGLNLLGATERISSLVRKLDIHPCGTFVEENVLDDWVNGSFWVRLYSLSLSGNRWRAVAMRGSEGEDAAPSTPSHDLSSDGFLLTAGKLSSVGGTSLLLTDSNPFKTMVKSQAFNLMLWLKKCFADICLCFTLGSAVLLDKNWTKWGIDNWFIFYYN